MDYTRKIAIAAVLVFSAAVQGAEPAQDPFLGRWVLDTKASKYPGRTCPKRMLIEMKMEARGRRTISGGLHRKLRWQARHRDR